MVSLEGEQKEQKSYTASTQDSLSNNLAIVSRLQYSQQSTALYSGLRSRSSTASVVIGVHWVLRHQCWHPSLCHCGVIVDDVNPQCEVESHAIISRLFSNLHSLMPSQSNSRMSVLEPSKLETLGWVRPRSP